VPHVPVILSGSFASIVESLQRKMSQPSRLSTEKYRGFNFVAEFDLNE